MKIKQLSFSFAPAESSIPSQYANSTSSVTGDIGIAWQYLKREEYAKLEQAGNRYWEGLNLSVKDAIVKPVSRELAANLILKYEWLGCMPAVNYYYFGIFFDGVCGGVVVFGPEYSENLGVWDSYGFTGKMLLLSRGVCLHWTPKNTGSRLIMAAIDMLPSEYEVITATTDHLAGEVGTLYQACNFHYVGSMRESNPKVKGRMERFGVLIDGKLYGSRSIRAKVGSQRKSDILAMYPNAEFVAQRSKHRYFIFRGSRKVQKAHLSAIRHLIKPYPKRQVP